MVNGQRKPFDQVVTEHAYWHGPYRVGRVHFGQDITYERDRQYWAQDVNVRRGTANFDRITFKIYKDNTAQLEAFKAGEFDFIQPFQRRRLGTPRASARSFDTGELVKGELQHKLPTGVSRAMCSTPACPNCRMCACARPWGWRWTMSG